MQERSRFKILDGHSARESALSAAGLHFDGKAWTNFSSESAKRFHEAGWDLSEGFPEVPAAALKRERWKPKLRGKWRFNDNIVLLEARAVFKALKRLAMTRFGHGIRHLHLRENLGVVLAIERCRSKNFELLSILRKIAAYCLSRNIFLSIRWIPSELNVSDEPSRIYGPEKSKLLVDLVADDFGVMFSPQARPEQHGSKTHSNTQQQCQQLDSKAAAEEVFEGADSGKGDTAAPQECSYSRKEVGRVQFLSQALDREEGDIKETPSDRGRVEEAGSCREQGQSPRRVERLRPQRVVRVAGRNKRREASFLAKSQKKTPAGAGSDWYGDRSEHLGGCRCLHSSERAVQQIGRAHV